MAVVGNIAVLGGGVQADDRSPRPPVRLELDACLDPDRDAIQRAVRIELGEEPVTEDAHTVVVQVECAGDGLDDGVVLEVRRPDNPRRYRYALHWRTQPPDARTRLLGLAVAEAVDASRIELTAVPELPPPTPPVLGPAVAATLGVSSAWTLSMVGGRRSFATRNGFALFGVGLMPSRRLSRHVRLAIDLTAETTAVVVQSGAIQVQSLSSAPHLLYHVGDRLYAEVGAGVRVGVVRMAGEALPGGVLVGTQLTRAWFGPAATASIGFELTPTMALAAGLELGIVGAGVTARELNQPAAAVGGRWTQFGLAAAIAL